MQLGQPNITVAYPIRECTPIGMSRLEMKDVTCKCEVRRTGTQYVPGPYPWPSAHEGAKRV